MQYSFVLPLIFFFVYINKTRKSNVCIIILIYCIIFFCLNFFYENIPKDTTSKKVYYFSYTLCEYLTFAAIFWLKIKNLILKRLIALISVLFILFQIIYFSTVRLKRLDTVPIGVETILIYFFAIYFLYEEFRNTKKTSLLSDHFFWISIGILFYLGGAFFFYILANHLDRNEVNDYWYLSYNADIVKNLLFTVAIYIYGRKAPSLNSQNKAVPYLDMI